MQVKFFGQTWPSRKAFVGDFIAAASIFAIPVAIIWGYYLVTGQPLNLG